MDSLASRGCHRLIRDGARLVETVDDILEELGPLVREVQTAPDEPPVRNPAELVLSDQERSLLGRLDDHPVGVDELITRTRLTASQVLATLSVLELKRLVRRLPGAPVHPGVTSIAARPGCYSRFLGLAARPPFAGRIGVGFVLFWKRLPRLIPGRGGPPTQKSRTVA